MLENLYYKQVKCSDLGILSFLFPTFKIVHTLYPNIDSPFIYCGTTDMQKLSKYDVPYIVASNHGDYNLDDRIFLIELASKKHNIKIKTDINKLQLMSYNEFLIYWKYLWLLGEEINTPSLITIKHIQKALEYIIDYPTLFLKYIVKHIDEMEPISSMKYLLIFIRNVQNNTQTNFINMYKNNISFACTEILNSSIENKQLLFLNFAINLVRGNCNEL